MKTTATIIALLIFCNLFCQQELELFKNDAYGRPLYLATSFPTEGTPYYSDNYYAAQITAMNGNVYAGIKVKINLVDHFIQYMSPDGKEMITDMPVKKIAFANIPVDNGGYENVTLQSFAGALNDRDAVIYEVLDSGKISLLKKITVIYRDDKKYSEASTTRIYERKEAWCFLDTKGQIKKLEKGKSAMLEVFNDNKDKVASFIDQHKLTCRSGADYKNIFRFYNTIGI
jgi:hypothetical protein